VKNRTIVFTIVLLILNSIIVFSDFLNLKTIIKYDGFKYPIATTRTMDNIFALDMKTKYIYRFSLDGSLEMKFGGPDSFKLPVDIESDGLNNIYVLDSHNNDVKKFDVNGMFKGISAQDLYYPSDIYRGDQGRFYIADYGKQKVKVYDSFFNLEEEIDCIDENDKKYNPTACAGSDNKVYISDWDSNKINVYSIKGVFIESIAPDEKNSFYKVEGIIPHPDGYLTALDWGNSQIKVFDEKHKLVEIKGGFSRSNDGLKYPSDIKKYDETIIVTDSLNKRIKLYSINVNPAPRINITNIRVPVFPILDIFFKANFDSFDPASIELYLNGNLMKIKETDERERRVRVDFPKELVNRQVDFYGYYNYNGKKILFEKKIKLEEY